MTRTFSIPTMKGDHERSSNRSSSLLAVCISLHEPPLVSDALGLKTWGASYLLAKRLPLLVPSIAPIDPCCAPSLQGLELGSGTGLVGLAAAALFGWRLHLTDLPEVVPNLARNIAANRHLFRAPSEPTEEKEDDDAVLARVLDWERPLSDPYWRQWAGKFDVVLASDLLYSPQHPRLVVDCISLFLRKPANQQQQQQQNEGKMACGGDGGGRLIVECPLRPSHLDQVSDFEERLAAAGLVREMMGEEVGWDDWGPSRLQQEQLRLDSNSESDGQQQRHCLTGGLHCRWSVWRWKSKE